MDEEQLDALRDKTRSLCSERGLAIVPYGPSWWIVGDGVNRVVADLAYVGLKDLEPLPVAMPKISYREALPRHHEGYFRCMRISSTCAPPD